MEDDAVEKPVVHVGEEVFRGDGGFFVEQLHFEVAQIGFEH
jgi:hypothetical protein